MCPARYSFLSPTCNSTSDSSLRCAASHSVETMSDSCTFASPRVRADVASEIVNNIVVKAKRSLFIGFSGLQDSETLQYCGLIQQSTCGNAAQIGSLTGSSKFRKN